VGNIKTAEAHIIFFGRADPDLVFFLELVTELQRDELGWCDWQGALE